MQTLRALGLTLFVLGLGTSTTAAGAPVATAQGDVAPTAAPGGMPRHVVRVALNAGPAFAGTDVVYELALAPWLRLAGSVGGGAMLYGDPGMALGRLHVGSVWLPLAGRTHVSGLRLGLGAEVYLSPDLVGESGAATLGGLPALSTQVGYGWQLGGLDVTAGLGLTVPAVPLLFALPWASVGVGKSF